MGLSRLLWNAKHAPPYQVYKSILDWLIRNDVFFDFMSRFFLILYKLHVYLFFYEEANLRDDIRIIYFSCFQLYIIFRKYRIQTYLSTLFEQNQPNRLV